MTREKALRTAETIRSYWRRLGAPVRVWIVREAVINRRDDGGMNQIAASSRMTDDEYTVRSDLVCGRPRSWTREQMAQLTRTVRLQFEGV